MPKGRRAFSITGASTMPKCGGPWFNSRFRQTFECGDFEVKLGSGKLWMSLPSCFQRSFKRKERKKEKKKKRKEKKRKEKKRKEKKRKEKKERKKEEERRR